MKEFLISTIPAGSILALDVSGATREARFYPSEPPFATWKEAEKFFLNLGASQDVLNSAASQMNKNGVAKLTF